MITLDTFTWPEGAQWVERMQNPAIVMAETTLLTGHLLLETDDRVGGMPITLQSHQINRGWAGLFDLGELQALRALHATEQARTLTIDGVVYAVRFDRTGSDYGLAVQELVQARAESYFSERIYAVTARFLTVSAEVEAL